MSAWLAVLAADGSAASRSISFTVADWVSVSVVDFAVMFSKTYPSGGPSGSLGCHLCQYALTAASSMIRVTVSTVMVPAPRLSALTITAVLPFWASAGSLRTAGAAFVVGAAVGGAAAEEVGSPGTTTPA